MAQATEDIRNIALIGHAAAGKTLLAEALLHHGGAIRTKGDLGRGTTVCDFDPLEKEFGHSLDTAVCHFQRNGALINLIDTPGYPDLLGRSISVLPAVETAAVVVSAQAGIEIATRRMMEAAAKRSLCRIVIISKIDVPDADPQSALLQVREVFGKECLPINLPADHGKKVLDCFFTAAGDDTDFSSVKEAHRAIIEQVVEVDETILARYLEAGEELPAEQLHEPFERALREGHLVPVCFVSAQTGAGLAELVSLMEKLLPNPREANPPPFLKGEGDGAAPVEVSPDAARHALAHVFKISIDPYLGRVAAFRVHQGQVRSGAQLFIGDQRKAFKVAHLYRVQGKDLVEVQSAIPGEICAVAKVDELHYDAVLHDSHDEDHHHLRSLSLSPPMLGVAIEPARRGEEQKLADALHRLTAEDPSLRVQQTASLNETALYGMGEMHLRVVTERMRRQYHADIKTHPPSTPYRETITAPAEGHHRHKKQTGGAGQFGEVYLRIEPRPRGAGYEFLNEVVGGAISGQFILSIEKGVRQAVDSGVIAGFPMQDVRVTVYDGKMHSVDSKDVAFMTAGRKAFLDAVQKARPIVLEPIMNISITAPAGSIGGITGDLVSLRGHINGQSVVSGNLAVIEAQAPLNELRDYYNRLKSHTSGEGSYTMEFSHYEPVPPRVQQDLVSIHAKRRTEED